MTPAARQEPVARHKTAISRTELSRPIKLVIVDRLLSPERSILDYGCGLGDDLRLLHAAGYAGIGWDPVHRPAGQREPAPVVTLGYVVKLLLFQELVVEAESKLVDRLLKAAEALLAH